MVRPNTLKDIELGGYREQVAKFIETALFMRFITTLILLNALTLGIEADPHILSEYDSFFHIFDIIVIAIFTVEILLKLYAYRLDFFKVGWNIFDFVIVAISLVPQSAGLSILRAFRVFRVFRLVTVVPQLRSVIGALFHAIPGMASIIGILFVIIYVAAVLSMQLFGQVHDPVMQGYYGSIGESLYTMFQLMTLEDWPDIARPTISHHPWAWSFFVIYIVVTSFAVLNLFIGIIVDALHLVKEQDVKQEEDALMSEIAKLNLKLDVLQKDINELRKK